MKNYNTKCVVRLTAEDHDRLDAIVRTGNVAAGRRRRAQILLKADAGSESLGLTDAKVAEALDVSPVTVQRVRRAYVEQGLEGTLRGKVASAHRPRKLNGEQEAHLIAIACGPPPDGHARWTIRLLGTRLVELEIVDSICPDTVHRTLKKTLSNHG